MRWKLNGPLTLRERSDGDAAVPGALVDTVPALTDTVPVRLPSMASKGAVVVATAAWDEEPGAAAAASTAVGEVPLHGDRSLQ